MKSDQLKEHNKRNIFLQKSLRRRKRETFLAHKNIHKGTWYLVITFRENYESNRSAVC